MPRTETPHSSPPLPHLPFQGKRELINGVHVRFRSSAHSHVFDCGQLVIRPGDELVVQTSKGLQFGRAASLPERQVLPKDDIYRVVRRASESDEKAFEACQRLEERGTKECIQLIRKLKLSMKLVKVEYLLDHSKAIFYFTSENRVDFRTLVRQLANALRIRIEMRQIGIRDGAGVIGGVGPCGRQLCCSSYLRSFRSVSIRHAKAQGISLNPKKITGMCGRLKCCLTYEEPVYKEMKKYAPKKHNSVLTATGPGTIKNVDPLGRRITVKFPGGPLKQLHIRDVVLLERRMSDKELRDAQSREKEVMTRRRQRSGGGRKSIDDEELGREYLWADSDHDLSFFSSFATDDSSQG